jgi:uncharacterized protein (DUF2141 family)
MTKVKIEVQNLSTKGAANVQIAIYDKANFLKTDIPNFSKIIKRENYDNFKVVFNLPQGEYAAAIFQDLNEDGKMNTNFFGLPTDPYGFSNNYKPVFRGPRFDDCVFNVKNEEINLSIKLIK